MRARFFAAAFAALFALPVFAQDNMVGTRLLVDAGDTASGSMGWVGVQFTIPPQWHIYWQNPGDSGIPTSFKWTLPEGVEAGPIQWPVPHAVDTSGIVNYGYDDHVLLQAPLHLTSTLGKADAGLKVDWLVCHDTCIPESASFHIALPQHNTADAAKLQAARDAMPVAFPGKASFSMNPQEVQLSLVPNSAWDIPAAAEFLPVEDGVIKNGGGVAVNKTDDGFSLTMPRGDTDAPASWHGLLRLRWHGKPDTVYTIEATPGMAPLLQHAPTSPFLWLALLAFGGGLLLNFMPCVLPILSLKALALVKKADLSPRAARAQGLAYTFGVIASFVAIAGLMLALKASGEAVGWGFQLQSPIIVGVLFVLMLAVSLNMFGAFHLPPVLGHVMVSHDGLRGTFLTGALAVLVATPCTAPFMATAVGATLTLDAFSSLLIFASMGLGMASPFLLISLWPAARRLLPRPGKWMHRFRQVLAVPMLLTALWFGFVLLQLLHPGMHNASGYTLIKPEPFSEAKLASLRAANEPVFVDATAAWCLTCKVNEKVALKDEATQQYFHDHHITLLIADWTQRDADIAHYLATFGRNGVPLYVYYPPAGSPVILPQLLTPTLVQDTLSGNVSPQ